ncbi:hypothetical protein [Pseudoroseicyclus sp. CXY001]|uniref:hypothetical protein n=1 Tax=Pseudoroseicyclus sp. CXY001 TaxID=3242492 RepID=UPI003570ECEF
MGAFTEGVHVSGMALAVATLVAFVVGCSLVVWLVALGMGRTPKVRELWSTEGVAALGRALSPVAVALVLLALVAVFAVLWRTIFLSAGGASGLWGRVFGGPSAPAAGLGTSALIAAVLGAPFVIWRSWVAHRTAETAEIGLLAERISNVVELLGSGDEAVRMGAVYTLEAIMLDSAQSKVMMWTILNQFLSYRQKNLEQTSDPPDLPIDIQAALTVITRTRQD